jgi:hypothetical protein
MYATTGVRRPGVICALPNSWDLVRLPSARVAHGKLCCVPYYCMPLELSPSAELANSIPITYLVGASLPLFDTRSAERRVLIV